MPVPHTLRITQAGLNALGPFDPLPKGGELRALRLQELGTMERAMLNALFEAYPDGRTKAQLYAHTDYKQSGDTSKCFAKFVRLGWATQPAAHTLRAADFFFEE